MELLANPRNRPGDRNIDCPHYRSCLDHAAKLLWNYWDCSACKYKLLAQSITVIDCSPRNADLFNSLSPEIFSKMQV